MNLSVQVYSCIPRHFDPKKRYKLKYKHTNILNRLNLSKFQIQDWHACGRAKATKELIVFN